MSEPAPICIRIIDVRHLRAREGRAAVCYCGRAFAGWPRSEWCNPFPVGMTSPNNYRVKIDREHSLELFRGLVESRAEGGALELWLWKLWEACDHGAKPLGCWCGATGEPRRCHS